jgi:hypothetical protein
VGDCDERGKTHSHECAYGSAYGCGLGTGMSPLLRGLTGDGGWFGMLV